MSKNINKVDRFRRETKNIWFPNQREPFSDDPKFKKYWARERYRCINGFYIADGQVYIPGLLYWHTVYWNIELDLKIKNPITGKEDIFKGPGVPKFRDIEWEISNEIFECMTDKEFYALVGSRGFGKMLRNSEPVITEEGEKPIGDCKVGDKIYGRDGKLTSILGVYPQGLKQLYRMTLLDGRTIDSGEEHLWGVYEGKNYKVLSTKELMDKKLSYKYKKSGNTYKFYLPEIKPVEYSEKEFKIHPYIIGALIGNGKISKSSLNIASEDLEVIEKFKRLLPDYNLKLDSGKNNTNRNISYYISYKGSDKYLIDKRGANPLKRELINLNLNKTCKEKRIPEIYQRGSVEQRMELLRGLMDTDGSINTEGSIEYTTVNKGLAEDVLYLCRSLGIKCQLGEDNRIGRISKLPQGSIHTTKNIYYRVFIRTSLPIFSLSRKLSRIKNRKRTNNVAIKSIEKIDMDYATCIMVDNEDKLFLSKDYIPTHNSMWLSSIQGWGYSLFDNVELLNTGGNHKDIAKLSEKIEFGLSRLHPSFHKQRIKSNWKEEVRAGYIDMKTGLQKGSDSRILARNYRDGNNTMATNGTRPKYQTIDEIGKIPNLKACMFDSNPSWMADGGVFSFVFLAGCVCAGTKVYTNDGRVVNIEDLKQEDGIIGFDGKKSAKQIINWFKPPAKKPCYRITTDNNTVIECSDDHPLLITKRKHYKYLPNKQKIKKVFYQEAKHIQINDQVITVNEVNVFGDHFEKDARLLGLMIGDGNYSLNSTPTLSVSEKEIFDFIKPFSNGSSNNYTISNNREYKQVYISYIKDKLIDNKMYGQVKENKRLPYNIHTYNRESLCELLGGYFDADGNVYYNEKKNIVRVVLTSVVYELLEEVKYQLLKLGIHSSIIKEKRNTKPSEEFKGQKDYIYRLYISQQQDLLLFKNNIKLLVKEKADKLNLIKESKYKKFNGLFEINPLNNKEGYFNRGEKDNNILENLRYETVKSVEYIGEKEVYNLNCSINHNYISNSLITRQTGGDMEVGKDAGEIFNDPKTYNIKKFLHPTTNKHIGKFMPATKARNEYKEEWTLYKYLTEKFPEKYGNLQPHKDLEVIIMVSNEEKCLKEFVEPRREIALNSGDTNAIIKEKAYYPITPEECFLTLNSNDYPVEGLKQHEIFLQQSFFKPRKVELFFGPDGKVQWKDCNRLPVTDFPVKPHSDKTGVVEILEPPVADAPAYLYVAGIDPYKTSETEYSNSVGSVYIWKRKTDDMTEVFQDMPVAWYHGRPKDIKEWQENVRMLLHLYNASAMCESNDENFIIYMQERNEEYMLARGQSYLKELNPNSKFKGAYGLPATAATINHWNNSSVRWTKELISKEVKGKDLKNQEVKLLMGYTKILDRMLIKELINFSKKEGNFDRQRAFSIACAYAKQLDANMGSVGEVDSYSESEKREIYKSPQTPFILNSYKKNLSKGNYVSSSPFSLGRIK